MVLAKRQKGGSMEQTWDKWQNPLFDKSCWENLKQYGRDQVQINISHPTTRINSEWVNDLNIKKETISKLGEHRIAYLSDLRDREDFKTKQEKKL